LRSAQRWLSPKVPEEPAVPVPVAAPQGLAQVPAVQVMEAPVLVVPAEQPARAQAGRLVELQAQPERLAEPPVQPAVESAEPTQGTQTSSKSWEGNGTAAAKPAGDEFRQDFSSRSRPQRFASLGPLLIS
jgi:hypothetical protein